jgi:ADP-heptose:LPS heptosyltransferase
MAVTPRPTALVLRALGVGDLLTAVPALRAVRRALPGHVVVLAAPPELRPLVDLVDAVDLLHPVPGPLPLSHPSPDVAVNLHGRGPASHQVLVGLRPGRLVGFGRADLGIDGPEWTDDEHEVFRWCRLVAQTLGGDPDPADLVLRLPPAPPVVSRAVVVHPGAAAPARRWPARRFAAVAAGLARMDCQVVVTGSPAERDLADRVRRLAGLPADACLAGRTTLTELAAVVAGALLVVSGDTGVGHLASAYRTPSVLLFGPTPPMLWGPPADGPHVVLWHGSGPGDPHASRPDPALLAITSGEVLHAVTRLIEDDVSGRGTCPPGVEPAVCAPANTGSSPGWSGSTTG